MTPDDPRVSTDPKLSSVISASAGTGKTWLLIARLLRLLLSGVAPESILAITFTNKAAHEIYERLSQRTREWAEMDEDTLRSGLTEIGAPPELSVVARTLFETLLNNNPVRITTFHSFCVDIVRLFPFDAEIPLNFSINDEARTEQLYDEALRELYVNALHDHALAEILDTLSTSMGIHNLRSALHSFLDRRNDWRAMTEARNLGTEDVKQTLARDMGVVIGEPPPPLFNDDLIDGMTEWAELLRSQTKILSSDDKALASIKRLLESSRDTSPDLDQLAKYRKCFLKENGQPRHSPDNQSLIKRLGESTAAAARVAMLEQEIGGTLDIYQEKLAARHNWRLNAAWYDCGTRLLAGYQTLQRRQKCLDFADLEWHACRLLGRDVNAQAIQSRLGARIRHVLVDEFQDTSPEQWLLIKPLLEEIASQPDDGSIFIVGDVKQSIYGFRRANPGLLEKAAAWLSEHINGRRFNLNRSRRSSPAIINLINRVFADSENSGTPLSEFELHKTYREDAPGDTGRLPYNKHEGNNSAESATWHSPLNRRSDACMRAHDLEAKQLAEYVAEYKHRQGLVWRDIMVLVRQRTHVSQYEAAFRQCGIPVFGGQNDSLKQAIETDDILALLRFIASPEPQRMLPLCQVLRSPLFLLGDEDLRKLIATPGDKPMDKMRALAQTDAHPIWSDACDLLESWIKHCHRLPPHDLLHLIYCQRDVAYRYRLATRDDNRDLIETRLLDLLHMSLDFQSGRYPDTMGFIKHLETLSKKYEVIVDHSTESDFVKLLTVHGAKGLEAKAVFLADSGPQKSRGDTHSALVDWPADTACPNCMLLLPAKKYRDRYSRKKMAEQEKCLLIDRVNLLYVALSRARDSLFISGGETANAKEEDWYHWLKPHLSEVTVGETKDENNAAPTALPQPVATDNKAIIRPLTVAISAVAGEEINPGVSKGHIPGRKTWRGKTIHRALQLLGEGLPPKVVQNYLRREMYAEDEALRHWYEEATTIFHHERLREAFDDTLYERVLNEMPIWFMHEGHIVSGRVDRVCVGVKQVWLIDYKTHINEEQAKRDSGKQMELYRSGAEKIWHGRAIRASILLTQSATFYDYAGRS